ncbi:MAG: PTPA-CTERM sorting domain-containing protein [Leptolyngbyaceae cyanobacterium bins.302]|nr:PTPA-CTERM sorting domain-containing protein [Leptolyngbyaceae cyanobacterium bins.302]
MSLMQQLFAKGAALAAVIAVGTLSSGSAQAAIVTGTVTGTWDYDYVLGNVTVGDTFKATYTYDDAALTPYSYSDPGYYEYTGWTGSLLSLIVESGTYSHTFDFASGGSYIQFEDFDGDPGYYYSDYRHFSVYGGDYDSTTEVSNNFYAYKRVGKYFNGTPFESLYASLYGYDYVNGSATNGVYTYKANFTPDPTAVPVPTPALLPGLIGMGVAALRKRKAEAAKLANEA